MILVAISTEEIIPRTSIGITDIMIKILGKDM